MITYRLKFHDDGIGCARTVEVDGEDAGIALKLLFWEKRERVVELWDPDQMLCTIERMSPRGDLWRLCPPPNPATKSAEAA